ncbi:MAG TPA: tetratricopeptide repeat protein, partial [Thermoanaerobaculia bacterium]|nr:tetratricopeptide repeat protein [Thermoanaerobaculia bacterium]
ETTLSRPGTIVGTSYAMSPEQAMGLPLDARSDLFSLGSLLYEMVTGVAPFRAETAQATLARVCSFRQCPASDIRPDVPRELSDLIDRLLEKDPAYRPGSAAEVATDLDRIATKREVFPAGAQVSLEESETCGQETDLEMPAWQIQASSSFERTAGQPLPDGLPAAAEPAQLSGSLAGQEPPLRRIRSLRTAIGIALLILVMIVAAYSLRLPAVQPTPHSLYQEGLTYLDRPDLKGNLDQAIDSFQKVLARDQTHAAAQAALARAYWFKFRSDSRDPMLLTWALSNAERAVALDPYLAAARVSLGLALMSDGRTDEAMRHIERALVLEPANGDAHYAAGRIHESQGRFKEAEAAYKKAAEVQPHRLNFDALGTLYYNMGRMEEAIAASRRSIELAPDGFIGYRNLGAAYHAQGDLAEAASQFQKALQIRPDATVYSNLGTVHFSQGFYQLSAEAFEKSLEMPGGANNYKVWGNLGDAYRWTPDQKERSRDAYLRGIQLVQEQLRSTPGDVTLRSSLALYLAKRGDLAEALAELHKLRDLPGKDAKAWLRMVVAYEVSAQRSEALAALGNALRAGASIQEVKDDPELLELRADARYHRLIAELSK